MGMQETHTYTRTQTNTHTLSLKTSIITVPYHAVFSQQFAKPLAFRFLLVTHHTFSRTIIPILELLHEPLHHYHLFQHNQTPSGSTIFLCVHCANFLTQLHSFVRHCKPTYCGGDSTNTVGGHSSSVFINNRDFSMAIQ